MWFLRFPVVEFLRLPTSVVKTRSRREKEREREREEIAKFDQVVSMRKVSHHHPQPLLG